MTRSRVRQPLSSATNWSLLAAALFAGSLASCDNPSCIFGSTGCQTLPGGGANQVSSTFPESGELIVPVPPMIQRVFPEGFAKPESPVVIVFSESISPSTIDGAFSVQTTSGIGGGQPASSALVGDGRVLILIPTPLIAGQEYQVVASGDDPIRDLSGALLSTPEDGVVGTFSVDPEPSVTPEILMSWPLDGSSDQSPITEIVTVFDRILNATTVTANNWSVQVDGVDPVFDPAPEVLTISAQGGGPIAETRVWTWRSVDPLTGERALLGTRSTVTIDVSSMVGPITTVGLMGELGEAVEPRTLTFNTLEFELPSSPMIESLPSDAIGIENLSPTGTRPFMMSVDFTEDAVAGDVLEIFMVGSNPPDPDDPDAPRLISAQREIVLTAGPGPHLIEQADFALLTSSSPPEAIFDDDDISFAFALRRGNLRSPVRVLDVDLTEDGVQDAFIDLTGPTFINLIGKEEGDLLLASDLPELIISGTASDQVRSVEVVAHLASGDVDNLVGGEPPPLPVFANNGAFVSAPVDIGQQEFGDTNFLVDVVVYDRALNPSVPATIDYTQIGASGAGMPISSGNDVDVTVFDSLTLAPIAGASIYRHESVGGVLTATITGVLMTDANGQAAVSPAPGGDTLITVEAAGYDLFTFQAVPTTRLDVPLVSEVIAAGLGGAIVSTPGTALTSPFNHPFLADSRVFQPGATFRESMNSTFNPLLNTTETGFPQVGVRLSEIGLVTFLATKDPADLNDPNLFSAGTFLQAFELEYPRQPLGTPPANLDVVGIQVQSLLSGADVDPADAPLGTPDQVFNKPPNHALDFPNPSGDPQVSVEALAFGIRGMMTVGLGLPYFNGGGDNWDIRAAFSARARSAGQFVSDLAIEDERYLRVEIVDDSGNRTGVRQPLSTATGTLDPAGVPLLTSPVANSGGADYDLVYENVITGALDTQGIYRVVLVDSVGRRWHLWTPDTAVGMGPIVTHVPPIALQGGAPLSDGVISAVIEAHAWTGFDPGFFMFADLARRSEQFTTASPKLYSQP